MSHRNEEKGFVKMKNEKKCFLFELTFCVLIFFFSYILLLLFFFVFPHKNIKISSFSLWHLTTYTLKIVLPSVRACWEDFVLIMTPEIHRNKIHLVRRRQKKREENLPVRNPLI